MQYSTKTNLKCKTFILTKHYSQRFIHMNSICNILGHFLKYAKFMKSGNNPSDFLIPSANFLCDF